MIIDSHCHLDYEPLINNIDKVLLNAKNNNILNLLTIGTNLESSQKVLDIVNKYPDVYGAVGIHPNSTTGNLDKLDDIAREIGAARPKRYNYGNLAEMLESVKSLEEQEGFCLYSPDSEREEAASY